MRLLLADRCVRVRAASPITSYACWSCVITFHRDDVSSGSGSVAGHAAPNATATEEHQNDIVAQGALRILLPVPSRRAGGVAPELVSGRAAAALVDSVPPRPRDLA